MIWPEEQERSQSKIILVCLVFAPSIPEGRELQCHSIPANPSITNPLQTLGTGLRHLHGHQAGACPSESTRGHLSSTYSICQVSLSLSRHGWAFCAELYVSTKFPMLKLQIPAPPNVTVFGGGDFQEVMLVRLGHEGGL